MKTVAIFGSTGMLGRYMKEYLSKSFKVICMDKFTAHTIDEENLVLHLKKHDDIQYVINCIGVVKQRNEATTKWYLYAVNSVFPQLLASACSRLNIKMIHVSTDCVFDGRKGNYTEFEIDGNAATDDYGASKFIGEPRSYALTIRTSIIGSESKRKLSLLEWMKAQDGKECAGYVNHYWNGVTCLQLAKLFEFLINNDEYILPTVNHYFSPNALSKFELLHYISQVYKLNIKIQAVNTPEPCNRTLATRNDARYYASLPKPAHVLEQLNEMYDFDKERGWV